MGEMREFTPTVRAFLRMYRWRSIDPVPWTAPLRPLAESRVALVSSAGFVSPGQEPFDERRGGDPTYRLLPHDVDLASLTESHRSDTFDHRGIAADANLALPLDRLREIADAGGIGELAPRHVSFMGSITAPGRFSRNSIPEITEALVTDDVDVAVMVPV